MKVQIKNRITGRVQFECELEKDYKSHGKNLGAAVKMALKEGVDLSYTDLRGARLVGANLQDAPFRGADLSRANMREASLKHADLCQTNLNGANFCDANLSHAILVKADMSSADMHGAKLYGANMSSTRLISAYLCNADFHFANLYEADLNKANLRGAGLIVLQLPLWTCYIQKKCIQIGCQQHKPEHWFSLTDEEMNDMSRHALEWSKQWKPVIQAAHEQLVKEVK